MTDPRLPIVPPEPALEDMWSAFHRALHTRISTACFLLQLDGFERLKDGKAREAAMVELDALLRAQPQASSATFARIDDRAWCIFACSDKEAEVFARALVHAGRKQRRRVSVGIALTRPNLRFETWLKVAEEGLSVARNAGGDRAVHTELYDLLERQLAVASLPISLRPPPPPPAPPPEPERAPEAIIERSATPSLDGEELREVVLPGPRALETNNHAKKPAAVRPMPHELEPVERRSAEQWRIDLIERRLDKVAHALEAIEMRLVHLETRSTDQDGGVASIYREVQGLDADTPYFDLKRHLMRSIFEANLELRARPAG